MIYDDKTREGEIFKSGKCCLVIYFKCILAPPTPQYGSCGSSIFSCEDYEIRLKYRLLKFSQAFTLFLHGCVHIRVWVFTLPSTLIFFPGNDDFARDIQTSHHNRP